MLFIYQKKKKNLLDILLLLLLLLLLVLLLSLLLLLGKFLLFGKFLRVILDVEGNNVILSAKYSLINSAQQLPLDLTQIRPNSVVHVRNLIFELDSTSKHSKILMSYVDLSFLIIVVKVVCCVY